MIKTRSVFTRTATEIIEGISAVCTELYQSNLWQTTVLEKKDYVLKCEEDQGIGTRVIAVKLRIERIPQGFLDKLLRLLFGGVGLSITIPPVNGYVRIHAVKVDIVFGKRKIDRRRSILTRALYQQDLDKVLSALKEKVPEINTFLV